MMTHISGQNQTDHPLSEYLELLRGETLDEVELGLLKYPEKFSGMKMLLNGDII
jgi:hypothetical protein